MEIGPQGLQWPIYHRLPFAHCQIPALGSGHPVTGGHVHLSHFCHVILLAVVTLNAGDQAERYASPLQTVVGSVHAVHYSGFENYCATFMFVPGPFHELGPAFPATTTATTTTT
jgi:hypothetical protein